MTGLEGIESRKVSGIEGSEHESRGRLWIGDRLGNGRFREHSWE